MCGIVAGIAERNIVPILLEGLRRLEYRGYDSAGIAVLDPQSQIQRIRSLGKIENLENKLNIVDTFSGHIGIAHTRWATHGAPAEKNAHPHICNQSVSVVHNGIIENHQQLKQQQIEQGYRFTSDTDTEVIAHAVHQNLTNDSNLLAALQKSLKTLKGAYALAVMSKDNPNEIVVARKGSPLVIGLGIGENFIASDVSALLPVTQNFIFLEEGDTARVTRNAVEIFDHNGQKVARPTKQSALTNASIELGEHRHFMHKEIFEQPQAIIDTLEGRVTQHQVLTSTFGHHAESLFQTIKRIQIIACGTSYHAGLVAKYWFEDIIGMSCQIEVASEYRYRNPVLQNNTLLLTLSQSGETADTLAALQQIKQYRTCHSERSEGSPTHTTVILSEVENQKLNIPTLTICNVPESSLTRESDLTFLTHAGPEIGVASTKAFTTQLVALALLLCVIGKVQNRLDSEREALIVQGLHKLPGLVNNALAHEELVKDLANQIATKTSAIFLGRGSMYPIAMEAALKLKEISYIHAEAYPAGELKHGPLALIDENIPVIAIAPHDELLEKLKSNLQEVNARGGQLYVFEDEQSNITSEKGYQIIKATTNVGRITAPITFNIPLQLLAYHVAIAKGTDVDRPRNLAKSVTVE
jgi:glucosamine--fructose-6-phosphate aminotransferase (isomerizing)